MEKNTNNRRDFIKKTAGILGLGVISTSAVSLITGCEQNEVLEAPPPENYEIDLSLYPALLSVGGVTQLIVTLSDGSEKNVAIIRRGETEFTAVEAICRHQNCGLTMPSDSSGNMVCNCHQAEFSTEDGRMLDSKAISPSDVPDLEKYTIFEFDQANNILKVII